MCDKVISENGGTLKSVPDCYKNHEMFNKVVDNNFSCVRICSRML